MFENISKTKLFEALHSLLFKYPIVFCVSLLNKSGRWFYICNVSDFQSNLLPYQPCICGFAPWCYYMRPKVQEGAAAYSQSSFIRCSRRGARRKKIRVAQISGITDLAAPTYVSNEHRDVILTDPRKMKIERNWKFENSLWASLFNLREMRLKPKRQFTCSRNSHLASPYLLRGHL